MSSGFQKAVVLTVILGGPFSHALANNSCPPTDLPNLQKILEGSKAKKLIFFSSWCADCLTHLKSSEASDVILIASFDQQQRAEKTLDKLNIRAKHCLFDKGLTAHYGVKKVPAEIVLRH